MYHFAKIGIYRRDCTNAARFDRKDEAIISGHKKVAPDLPGPLYFHLPVFTGQQDRGIILPVLW